MKIAVIGAGSWGTTLALVLHENGHDVHCWTIEESTLSDVANKRENTRYLPGVTLPETLTFSMKLEEVLANAEMIISAVPSQVTRNVIPDIIQSLDRSGQIWVCVSKGIENDTYLRVSEVIHEVGKISYDKIVALSGPSHAEEVSRHIPTVVVSAKATA